MKELMKDFHYLLGFYCQMTEGFTTCLENLESCTMRLVAQDLVMID